MPEEYVVLCNLPPKAYGYLCTRLCQVYLDCLPNSQNERITLVSPRPNITGGRGGKRVSEVKRERDGADQGGHTGTPSSQAWIHVSKWSRMADDDARNFELG